MAEKKAGIPYPVGIQMAVGFVAAGVIDLASRVTAEVVPQYQEALSQVAQRIGVRPEMAPEMGTVVALLIAAGVVLLVSAIKSAASSGGESGGTGSQDIIYDGVPVRNGVVSQADLQRGFSKLAARNTGQDSPLGF
jgi:hypothetical protein